MVNRGQSTRTLIAACVALGSGVCAPHAQETGSLPSAPAQAATSGSPTPTRSAPSSKSGVEAAIADCMKLWDKGTHMSKQEWARTCRRIQTRLDNLRIENLKMMGADTPSKSRTGSRGSADKPN
jgi:hypothetical protein